MAACGRCALTSSISSPSYASFLRKQPPPAHVAVLSSSRDFQLICQKQQKKKNRSTIQAISSDGEEQQQPDAATVTVKTPETEKEELVARLAAAEAEAEALKKELAARRSNRDVDLAKLKPATPEKRIDGTGYRETLFSGSGEGTDDSNKKPNSWGLLETELFLSKGAPTEGSTLGGPAMEDGANAVVTRRLLIGLGITVVAVALSFLKLPAGLIKPPKPLFFYLGPIIRLRDQLKLIEESSSDANSVREKLQQALNPADVSKDTFLSAAGWLEGTDADKAVSLTYTIFDYLNQADYNKYFEALGTPSVTQQLEFLKFSLRSVQAARENLDFFLSIMPQEALEAASNNIKFVDKPILLQSLDVE